MNILLLLVITLAAPRSRVAFKTSVDKLTDRRSCEISAPLGLDFLYFSSGEAPLSFHIVTARPTFSVDGIEGGLLRMGEEDPQGLRWMVGGRVLALVNLETSVDLARRMIAGDRVRVQWMYRDGATVTKQLPQYDGLRGAYLRAVELCGWPELE